MMRAPDHKNFRECGDPVMRVEIFLRGLAARERGSNFCGIVPGSVTSRPRENALLY